MNAHQARPVVLHDVARVEEVIHLVRHQAVEPEAARKAEEDVEGLELAEGDVGDVPVAIVIDALDDAGEAGDDVGYGERHQILVERLRAAVSRGAERDEQRERGEEGEERDDAEDGPHGLELRLRG
eukprot:scaffold162353_cov39-Tisochrysis_lutea.AAC.3